MPFIWTNSDDNGGMHTASVMRNLCRAMKEGLLWQHGSDKPAGALEQRKVLPPPGRCTVGPR